MRGREDSLAPDADFPLPLDDEDEGVVIEDDLFMSFGESSPPSEDDESISIFGEGGCDKLFAR